MAQQILQGHVPEAVTRLNLRAIGRLPGTNRLNLAIGLPYRNKDVLAHSLQQIYDPANPNYHHYLTPNEFTAMFGPTEQDYQAIIAFAKANGLTVKGTHPTRTLLDVEAPVTTIERVFHVKMYVYQHPVEKRKFFAPATEPAFDLNTPVLHITGLDNYTVPHPNLRANPSNTATNATPNTGSGQGGNYQGNDFRNAYTPGATLTGSGQVLGLLELDGYNSNDITAYRNLTGIPNVPLQNVLLDGFSGSAGSNNEEVCLDIEMANSMAPGLSKVIVYEAPMGTPLSGNPYWVDILDEMAAPSQGEPLPMQLSSSWTFGEDNPSADQTYRRFATQGQSFFQASGDDAAYYAGITEWADNPYVTIVGGTTLTTSSGGAWTSETTWNSGYDASVGHYWASGGGISENYSIPSWQDGISMSLNQGSTTMRNVPDVSMVADDILVTYNNGDANSVSGTSAATPLWAAFTALANEQALASGLSTVGFINPAIYSIGKSPPYSSTFHDIADYSNNGDLYQLFFAVAGYDLCTGWGTPNGVNLINSLAPLEGVAQAPASLAGNSFEIGITSGTYPFAAAGYFLLLPANKGNAYQIVDVDGGENSSGTYSYAGLGATGAANFDDSIGGSLGVDFSFSTATSGSYLATNATFLAYQSGNFEMFSGEVPAAINGNIFECTVEHGLSPFANTGSFSLIIADSGNRYAVQGDGINTANSSGSYSYSEINGTTGAMEISDSVSGSSTAYLVFSSTNTGGFAITSPSTGGFQVGHFVTTYTGSLRVFISPAAAVAAGAQWQVDGGTLQNSGTALTNLAFGNHAVSFTSVSGWTSPANQTITVRANSAASVTGTYVAIPKGSLQVTISPAAAIKAGAQWRIDGGTLQSSGATVTNLSVGNYTVSFNAISGWTTPSNQTVSVKNKLATTGKASYAFIAQGIYNGLFMQDEPTEETAGMLSGLDVTASGSYSGKVLVGGGVEAVSGSFDAAGVASNFVERSTEHGGPLALEMTLNWNNSPPDITGTVSGTNGGPWMANLTAELADKGSSSAAYTALVLPGGTPPGYGYLLITNHTGAVTLSGALADGTLFSQAVPVSGAGDLPVYGNLYKGTGLLLGWIGLESGSPTGNLTWIKDASRTTAFYTNGFTNLVGIQGSPWTNPVPHNAAIDLPFGQLEISGASLVSPLSFNVTVSNNNALVKLPGSATNSLSGSINPKTGLFTITFGNGLGKATTAGTGAVLQNATNAAGFFLGKTNGGSILLQP
jgi:subtilase family serine protease